MTWFAPIGGLRGFTHLALIALHAAMTTTSSLPDKGEVYAAYNQSWVTSTMLSGGTQVDVFLAISGFLLTHRLLTSPSDTDQSFTSFLFKRATRLWPAMCIGVFLDHFLGGDYSGFPYFPRAVASFLFYQNYMPIETHGTWGLAMCWSNCVDIHCSVVLFLLVGALKKGERPMIDTVKLFRRVLFVFLAIALAVRVLLFDPPKLTFQVMVDNAHWGHLKTGPTRAWVEETYTEHKWLMEHKDTSRFHYYFNNMYAPSHTRFGPYVVGALLATNVIIASQPENRYSTKIR